MVSSVDHPQAQAYPATPAIVKAEKSSGSPRERNSSFFARNLTLVNFWVDVVLLVSFLALVWISVVVQFLFPPAEHAAGYLLWGMGLSQVMQVQFGILCFFFAGVVLHLMLHWSWVCGVVGGRLMRARDGKKRLVDDGERTIFGVGLMIVLLNVMGLGIAVAALSIQSPF